MCKYQLFFGSMPEVGYAHRYDTDSYNIFHPAVPEMMEITYVLRGGCSIEQDGGSVFVPEDSVIVSVYDRIVRFTCDGYHQHTTVGFRIQYRHVSEGGLILPHVMSFDTDDNPVRVLLEQLVLHYNMDPASPQVTAMLFELMGKISVLYQLGRQKEQNFGQNWYIKRAQKYIVDHISQPLRVTEIAEMLGISSGYLSHLFTDLVGQTVTGYINTLRIKLVEELVLTYGLDIRQAGAQVGLTDPNYISRLFRRVRGCSLSELRHARFTLHKDLEK